MKYQVISRSAASDLATEVCDLMEQGWRPLGGVSVSSHAYTYTGRKGEDTCEEYTYAQAMIKEPQSVLDGPNTR